MPAIDLTTNHTANNTFTVTITGTLTDNPVTVPKWAQVVYAYLPTAGTFRGIARDGTAGDTVTLPAQAWTIIWQRTSDRTFLVYDDAIEVAADSGSEDAQFRVA